MSKTIMVRDIVIGEGPPKICVPMVGETIRQLIEEANYIKDRGGDLAEWRVDYFGDADDINKVEKALQKIREAIPGKPIIFSFRTAGEGGHSDIPKDYYLHLNRKIAQTKLLDLIDIELFTGEDYIKEMIETAHSNNIKVIVSNHDFKNTPSIEEIVSRLIKAKQLGGDIPKIAVMPHNLQDVLTLLDATRTITEELNAGPVITMAMGKIGLISRLTGELFGSALTFGTAKTASAPGQIPATELRTIIELIHTNLNKT